MTEFLRSILDTFISLFAFLGNIISGTLQLLRLIPQSLNFLTYSLSSLPAVVAVIATALISVSVVYLIVGR